MSPPIRVLFVCTANACRSQMAEAMLRHQGRDRFTVSSAGIRPIDRIHPLARAVIESLGLSADGLSPKGIERLAGTTFDIVITLCDSAACLLPNDWPGRPVIVNWSLTDPVTYPGRDDERIALAHQVGCKLDRMIESLVAVPFEKLTATEIQSRLVRIGRCM